MNTTRTEDAPVREQSPERIEQFAAWLYLMQDIRASSRVRDNIAHPLGTLLYAVSCMHCMTGSLAQGGAGLGAMWGEQLTREYLTRAGFTSIETHQLPHDLQNNWYVVR